MAAAEASDGAEVTDGEQAGQAPNGQAEGAAAPRRRGQAAAQEVIDELATETKRTALLDRLSQQTKGRHHVSRLLMTFGCPDDRKIHEAVEQEFGAWRERQEKGTEKLTGVLLFVSQAQCGIQFLEGPTDLIFQALALFYSLTGEEPSKTGLATAPAAEKPPALINSLRVLHFTELHGVRVSRSWATYVCGGKLAGGQTTVLDETTSAELVFGAYNKFLQLCLKVQESVGVDAGAEQVQAALKKASELMPTIDEVFLLVGKAGGELFFSYEEFEKVFVAPFYLVLHSELLWPMPPPLSY